MTVPLSRYWALLAQYLMPLKYKVIGLAILVISNIILQIINPQVIRYFIDTAIAGGDDQMLVLVAVAFLLVALLLQIIGVATRYVSEDIGWQSTNRLRADLARHCLHLDMPFHNNHTPGEMIERIDGDVAVIASFFSEFMVNIISNLLLLVGVLVVLTGEDWRISLILGIYSIITLMSVSYLRHLAVPYWKEARQASANLFGFLEEQLAGTETTRSNGTVAYVMHNLFKLSKAELDRELRGSSMSVLIVVVWVGLFRLGQVIILYVGYTLFQEGVLTVGSVYLVVHYTNLIFRPLNRITMEIQKLQKASAGIERVEAIYNLESKIKDGIQPLLPPGPLAISFDKVCFGYNEADLVIQDISFELPPAKVLGVLGRTGSGKTTLARLLFRLYDPTQGTIRLGNEDNLLDIRKTTLEDLRQQVGMVTQRVQLFRATVRDNLTFFNKNIPDDLILDVIQELGLFPWYYDLPDGLDTVLDDKGENLSAGEAQLLAFTRAFLDNPALVILDEASSRLDPVTEKLLEQAMDKLLKDRTGILIAHRVSTVHRADYIMIIDDGQIQEFGEYTDLITDQNSQFYHLLNANLGGILS